MLHSIEFKGDSSDVIAKIKSVVMSWISCLMKIKLTELMALLG